MTAATKPTVRDERPPEAFPPPRPFDEGTMAFSRASRRYLSGAQAPGGRAGAARRSRAFSGRPVFGARRPRVPSLARILLAAAIAAVAVAFVVAPLLQAEDRTASPAPGAGEPAESTPRAEWAQGSVPFLYQTDPAWASAPYAGATVNESGCGPTCLSMVYVCLTGHTDLDPAGMAAFSEAGGFVEGDLTSWSLMTEGAAQLGLVAEELSADEAGVRAALGAGRPVVCSVGPGDFTTTGHFIVLAGTADDGSIVVHDPNSAERSSRTWGCARILEQCRNLWAFSRA